MQSHIISPLYVFIRYFITHVGLIFSGVGKGTLIDLLRKKFPSHFGFSVSHTTRNPREGEVNGVHYNFTTVDTMKKEIDEGKFVEYA